jgi:hypothetical protein
LCLFCGFSCYRFLAAVRAWRDNAERDAALRPSRFRARLRAVDRVGEAFLPDLPRARSRAACLRVRAEAWPFRGGLSFTPARRAFDNPMAIACFVDLAPCLPSRMCSISSRTNSPACVVGRLPSLLAFLARSIVFFSGIEILPGKRPQFHSLRNARLTRVVPYRRIVDLVLVLSKILIIVAVVGLLRSSPAFRSMSRDLDEQAFAALRRIMRATEDCGYPPQLIPLLMLLTALSFMLSMYVTGPYVR